MTDKAYSCFDAGYYAAKRKQGFNLSIVINLILCKDLSRFGRNYIEIGQFTDYIFPAIGCRFVALNDNVDTIHSDNDIMAYKNLFNEFNSRDTSKKVRTIRKARAESGKFMGAFAPYGYRKDETDKHLLIPDPRTAPVVQRIFEMRSRGLGYHAMRNTESTTRLALNKRELKNTETRVTELEKLIQSLYEDRVKGAVPETVFRSLMDKYERERLDKIDAAAVLREKITGSEREWGDASKWTGMIKKYAALETLDAAILLELIDRIEVGEARTADGQKIFDIKVYYRFIENLDLGELELEARYGQAV